MKTAGRGGGQGWPKDLYGVSTWRVGEESLGKDALLAQVQEERVGEAGISRWSEVF